MKNIKNVFNPKVRSFMETNDFSLLSVELQDGEYIAELETSSPAGEDLIIDIWYDGSTYDFVASFRRYATDFDPDEHAEGWIEFRGSNGVPNRIRELIDDADAIDAMLNRFADELYDAYNNDEFSNADLLTEKEIREDWDAALNSPMEYSEIAHAIKWGFDCDDMQSLMELHKQNKHRQKIEDLLEDCNFHTERSDWSEGNYILRDEFWRDEQ